VILGHEVATNDPSAVSRDHSVVTDDPSAVSRDHSVVIDDHPIVIVDHPFMMCGLHFEWICHLKRTNQSGRSA
jgi:hypothetical protein